MARRPDRGRPASTAPSPSDRRRDTDGEDAQARARWLGGLHFSGFSLLMLGLVVLGVVVLAPNIKAYVDQRGEIADLTEAVQEQKDDVSDLTDERERWDDPTYVETQARERFFYVKPGEISFIVINDLDETFLDAGEDPVDDELTATRVDWTQSLLSSILAAAFTDVDGASSDQSGTDGQTGGETPANTDEPSSTPTSTPEGG